MANQFDRRPLLLLLAGLTIGLSAWHSVEAFAALAALLILCHRLRSWVAVAMGLILSLIVAPQSAGTLVRVVHTKDPVNIVSQSYRSTLSSRAEGIVDGLRVAVLAPSDVRLHPGDVVRGPSNEASLTIAPVSELQDARFREERLQGTVRLEKVVWISRGPWIYRAADTLVARFESYLSADSDPEEFEWLDALWFRSRALGPVQQQSLMRSGASSFFAAAGLQIYFLFGIVSWSVGSVLGLDRRVQVALASLVVFGYWMVTGMHGSSLRACVVCVGCASAFLFRREPDVASMAALAGTGFLLFSPASVSTLGFQISMAIPIATGLFYRSTPQRPIANSMRVMAIVLLASQPLVALHLGSFGVGQPLCTVLLLPVASAILTGSVAGFGAGMVLPPLGRGIMLGIVLPLTKFLEVGIQRVAELPIQFDLPSFSAWWAVAYYGLWMATWRERRHPDRS